MENRLQQSLLTNTESGFTIGAKNSIRKAESTMRDYNSTNASHTAGREPPSAYLAGFEKSSMFKESDAVSKWSAEPRPKQFAATPRTASNNATPRGQTDRTHRRTISTHRDKSVQPRDPTTIIEGPPSSKLNREFDGNAKELVRN